MKAKRTYNGKFVDKAERAKYEIPVIDLFAGPGGLGEGFASAQDEYGKPIFAPSLSFEKEKYSHQTLLLRHFYRQFDEDEVPDEYYDLLAGRITTDELFAYYPNEYNHAMSSALNIALGPENHDSIRSLIRKRVKDSKRWVLVGGPPCQAYSLVGRSRMRGDPDFENDERHFLYREYLRTIHDHKPPAFVMENVKGLLSATHAGKSVFERILDDLQDTQRAFGHRRKGPKYRLYSLTSSELFEENPDPRSFVVQAEEFGVPQARHRVFIVGIRSDIKVVPQSLKPHQGPTVKQTIGNLPSVRSCISRGKDSYEAWQAEISKLSATRIRKWLNGIHYASELTSEISFSLDGISAAPHEISSKRYPGRFRSNYPALQDIYDTRLSVLTGHESRSHMPSDLRRYLFAATFAEVNRQSPKLADFPDELLPDHRNAELGRAGKMFSDRFRVQLPDRYSTTITSHISKDGHYFIHYDPLQCRSLTVREAARLQTFPDNYFFQGSRTSQFHQVGNAVPPYLARQIANVVMDVLLKWEGER